MSPGIGTYENIWGAELAFVRKYDFSDEGKMEPKGLTKKSDETDALKEHVSCAVTTRSMPSVQPSGMPSRPDTSAANPTAAVAGAQPTPSPRVVSETAAAVERISRQKQKAMRKKALSPKADEADLIEILGMMASGRISTNKIMERIAYSVARNLERDDTVTLAFAKTKSPLNSSVLNTKMRLMRLPNRKVSRVMTEVKSKGKTRKKEHSSFSKARLRLERYIDESFEGDDVKRAAVTKVAKRMGMTVSEEPLELCIAEYRALRRLLGCSGNVLTKLGRFLKVHKKALKHLIPPRDNVTQQEKKSMHEFTVKKIKLFTTNKDKDGKKTARKECLFWHLNRPASVIEDLVACAVLCDELQDSEDFSFLKNALVVLFGGDKASDDTTLQVRLGSRNEGNNGKVCHPLGQVLGGAAEKYYNLSRTLYSKQLPLQPYLQQLLFDNLHMLILKVKDGSGKVIRCRAVTARFAPCPAEEEPVVILSDERVSESKDDKFYSPDEDAQWYHTTPGQFHLATDKCGQCIGICASSNKRRLMSWRKGAEAINIPGDGTVELVCLRIVGFPSHDTKHGLICAGIGSPASSCPCLGCIKKRELFWKFPKWIGDADQSIPRDKVDTEEPTLRVGPHANSVLHQKYKDKVCGSIRNSEKRHVKLKKEVGSVVSDPFFDMNGKESFAPMHAPQGVFTHLGANIRKELRRTEKDSEWLSQVRSIRAEAAAAMAKSSEFKRIHKQVMTQENAIENILQRIEDAEGDPEEQERESQRLGRAEEILEGLIHNDRFGGPGGNYNEMGMKIQGGEIMVKLIDGYLDKKSKKPHGIAEFRFAKSYETLAKATYRAEHSGFELSHKHGLQVLKVWDDICDYATDSYHNEADAEMREKIKTLFDKSKTIATPLYNVSKIMKSQDKVDASKRQEFEREMVKLAKAWRNVYTFDDDNGQDVFIKLHHLETHVRSFLIKFGMIGRLSEEGFEESHPHLNADVKLSSNIPCKHRKIENILRRQNNMISPELVHLITATENLGKKRGIGSYNRKAKKRKVDEVVDDSVKPYQKEGWLEVDDLNTNSTFLIPVAWREVYDMCAYGKAPASWRQNDGGGGEEDGVVAAEANNDEGEADEE